MKGCEFYRSDHLRIKVPLRYCSLNGRSVYCKGDTLLCKYPDLRKEQYSRNHNKFIVFLKGLSKQASVAMGKLNGGSKGYQAARTTYLDVECLINHLIEMKVDVDKEYLGSREFKKILSEMVKQEKVRDLIKDKARRVEL